ncbi:MAG: L28 family ribosomal protein [Anaerotignum faecicola]
MAKCAICEKGQITGHRISIERSQVSRRANRKWKPNVKKVKIVERQRQCKIYLRLHKMYAFQQDYTRNLIPSE